MREFHGADTSNLSEWNSQSAIPEGKFVVDDLENTHNQYFKNRIHVKIM